MNLHDALFHWLQMKKVAEARPNDRAALDTMQFFTDVLLEDHQLAHFELFEQDEEFYYVSFRKMEEEEHSVKRFPIEAVDHLLADIEANPKYNEQ